MNTNIQEIKDLSIGFKSQKGEQISILRNITTNIRKGETVGNHEVIFSSPDETVSLRHKANDRGIFAAGAIYAVKWGQEKKPGLFSMVDVLGL